MQEKEEEQLKRNILSAEMALQLEAIYSARLQRLSIEKGKTSESPHRQAMGELIQIHTQRQLNLRQQARQLDRRFTALIAQLD